MGAYCRYQIIQNLMNIVSFLSYNLIKNWFIVYKQIANHLLIYLESQSQLMFQKIVQKYIILYIL